MRLASSGEAVDSAMAYSPAASIHSALGFNRIVHLGVVNGVCVEVVVEVDVTVIVEEGIDEATIKDSHNSLARLKASRVYLDGDVS
jgi:hypothetical protein